MGTNGWVARLPVARATYPGSQGFQHVRLEKSRSRADKFDVDPEEIEVTLGFSRGVKGGTFK